MLSNYCYTAPARPVWHAPSSLPAQATPWSYTFKAKTVITLGESEVESGQVNVKNNATREEVTVSFEELTKNFAAVLEQLEK